MFGFVRGRILKKEMNSFSLGIYKSCYMSRNSPHESPAEVVVVVVVVFSH